MTVDLRTTYLGLPLRNPLVVSACPLAEDLDRLEHLADAGVAAVVFPSLFEEQIEHDELEISGLYEQGTESFAESVTFFPELRDYNVGPAAYLRRLRRAKSAVSIPVIGSLNGATRGGWLDYARRIEDAGADALELNTYFLSADPERSSADVERQHVELVHSVHEAVSIPLAAKISPFFTAPAHFARQLAEAGADGLVLFNRFVHPDLDLETLSVLPHLELSRSYESRLPMTWIALLRGRVEASLAASTGIHSPEDALKLILVGADVTMVASSLYLNGVDHARVLLEGIAEWLEEHDYVSVEQARGSLSQEHCPDPTAFERAGYMRTLVSFTSHVP